MAITGIDAGQLRQYVIEPTLTYLAFWNPKIKSEAAIRLLLGTAAHESRMGHFLHQVGGPAVGPFQMEPLAYDNLWVWIRRQGEGVGSLAAWVENLRTSAALGEAQEMAGNLYLATGMARLYYWRVAEPLPHEDDVDGLAGYAKRWWNTQWGKATVADYAKAMREYEIA